MNAPRPFLTLKSAARRVFMLALLATGLGSAAVAQVLPVTAWTLSTITNNADTSSVSSGSGFTYLNKYLTIETFTAGGEVFVANSASASFVDAADNAYVRRSTATSTTNSNTNAFHIMTLSQSATAVHGQYYATAEELLLSGNILNAVGDAFTNTGSGSSVMVSNIERYDFVWSGGYLANPDDVIAVFNVDSVASQDDFRIAVFTAIDGSEIPTTYASTGLVINAIPPLVSGGDGTDTGTDPDYTTGKLSMTYPTGTTTAFTTSSTSTWRLRGFGSGDALNTASYGGFSSATQGIGGAAIRLSDLGITTSQVIYGYSLMGPDVTPATAADLVSWTNSSVYLTTTSDSQGTADFTAYAGRFIRPIPEPSTYGAILMGAGLAAYALRRRFGRGAAKRG